jgi:uncharacterized membrane protein YhhN
VTSLAWIPIVAGGLGLAALLVGVSAGRPRLFAAGKLTCSTGFVGLALALGVGTPYARIVLVGLLLSALGDLLLLSARPRPFLGGLVAFLLAHAAYATAFSRAGTGAPWVAALLALAALLVLRWLWPHLGSMRAPVVVYCAAISAMLWLALGQPAVGVRVGAALFYLSDLAVARQRFVAQEDRNQLVGLPLYFAGQYLIALSVG